MRITLNVVGVVLVAFGSIWFLQGINVLPGSFMTGQIRWAVHGGICSGWRVSVVDCEAATAEPVSPPIAESEAEQQTARAERPKTKAPRAAQPARGRAAIRLFRT